MLCGENGGDCQAFTLLSTCSERPLAFGISHFQINAAFISGQEPGGKIKTCLLQSKAQTEPEQKGFKPLQVIIL